MKIAVFWLAAPCRLIALMMEAVQTSEALAKFYQSTWRYNPEDSNLQFFPYMPFCNRNSSINDRPNLTRRMSPNAMVNKKVGGLQQILTHFEYRTG
jgi:hypothetical protein